MDGHQIDSARGWCVYKWKIRTERQGRFLELDKSMVTDCPSDFSEDSWPTLEHSFHSSYDLNRVIIA
jgi:hypothetical protein